MTKLSRPYFVLLIGFLVFHSTAIFGQSNTPCLGDTMKPVFERCPQDIVLTTTDSCAIAQWANPLAFDNCGIFSVTGSHQSGMCFNIGTTTVTYIATDSVDNSSICSFTVTVRQDAINPCANDTLKPRFTNCPQNIFLTTSDSCALAQWMVPTAVDNCSTPSVSGDFAQGSCFSIGATTVTYTAIDSAGNKAFCSFIVTVSKDSINPCAADSIKPQFISCPQNIVLSTSDSCARRQWPTPLATDNCGTPTITSNYAPTNCFPVGTTTVIYTAQDANGNTGTCSFTITVLNPCANDTIKPYFVNCPQNIVISTQDSCAKVNWATPFATDNCGTPTITSNYSSTHCFPIGTTSVVYTAKDAKGNTATCVFSVTVNNPCYYDSIKPRFYYCPPSIVVSTQDTCAKVNWNGPYATDNCGTPTITGNYRSGNCFPIGTTAVLFTATDRKGNTATCAFNVTVNNPCYNDTIKPRFTNCPTNITVTTSDSCARVSWNGPFATDNCNNPTITGNYRSGNCFPVGTTAVLFTASDRKGNTATCAFNVTVNNPCYNDTIKPRFYSCPKNIIITTQDSCARATWNGPFATDNCSTPTITGNYRSGNCFPVGTTAVLFTATDRKGNTATCAFNVTVNNPCYNDTIKPRFTNCPQNITVTTSDSCARVNWNGPFATDNCNNPTITGNYRSGNCFPVGTTAVLFTATDRKGNTATCAFNVTVNNPCYNDTIKPRFYSCPQNITVTTSDSCARATWNGPYATDNCNTPTITGNYRSGNCFPVGTTAVLFTATDRKGNKATCAFNVTVNNPCYNDTIKPRFTNCPQNITVTTSDSCARVNWNGPFATDNCSTPTILGNYKSGNCFPIGTTAVLFTATDKKGNTATCAFNITIKSSITPCTNDTVPPVFTNCPANITVTTASATAIAQWTKPTATDNCSTPSVSGTANSGSSFPVGTTTVVYTARDAKGNLAYCSFTVTVVKEALVIDSTKCYVLVARSSKKVLTIGGSSMTGGADAVQWAYLNGLNQKWMISTADSNSVNLTVKHSNMNLDTRWGALSNGSRLMQWTKSTALTQKWQLVPLSDGYFKVINKASGRALSVGNGSSSTTDGGLLVQLDYTGQTSQQWSIESVPCTTVTPNANFVSNDILDVDARAELNRARIQWVDNTGYKNDYYEIEKLNPTSGQFESLAIVNNTSFDNQATYQTAYDNAPTEGDNFYRVKVVYLDSLSKVSPAKKVSFNNLQSVKVYPNPANDFVDIDLSSYSNESVDIYLYNGFGQKMAYKTVQKGKNSIIHFDISTQPSGQYLIRIAAQGKRDVTKQLQIVR